MFRGVNAGTIHSLKTIKIHVRHLLLNRFSYKEKLLAQSFHFKFPSVDIFFFFCSIVKVKVCFTSRLRTGVSLYFYLLAGAEGLFICRVISNFFFNFNFNVNSIIHGKIHAKSPFHSDNSL